MARRCGIKYQFQDLWIIKIENKKNVVELEEKKKNIENLMTLQEQIKNEFKVILLNWSNCWNK